MHSRTSFRRLLLAVFASLLLIVRAGPACAGAPDLPPAASHVMAATSEADCHATTKRQAPDGTPLAKDQTACGVACIALPLAMPIAGAPAATGPNLLFPSDASGAGLKLAPTPPPPRA